MNIKVAAFTASEKSSNMCVFILPNEYQPINQWTVSFQITNR